MVLGSNRIRGSHSRLLRHWVHHPRADRLRIDRADCGKPKISGPLILLGIPVVDSYFLQSSTAKIALDSCHSMSHAAGWCCTPPAIA